MLRIRAALHRLSRVHSLEDLTLSRPLQVADVVVDEQVQRFYERLGN